ncbi:Phenylalanyl-trna synthetase [Orbilia oligospora]|uniref:Phenylalanine--tRNA ligase, mitochondrial n=1 Tax=Orbilia oligospora TaxID=2813651 RepID=A0A7C8QXM4_ORBOL|nr:Phenylalanyl-trna synthetase [Orbilia oligospora]
MQASRVFTPLSRRLIARQVSSIPSPRLACIYTPRSFHTSPTSRSSSSQPLPDLPNTITLANITHNTDSHTNIPSTLLPYLTRNLHLTPNHPISNTRQIIESLFPTSTFARYNTLPPVVTVAQNFDCLGFPQDHVGRSKSDTYYVNKHTVLRTHTSAHQAEKFRTLEKEKVDGYLISADVYRRDAIDKSHYPVFHQMEGARLFDRKGKSSKELVDEILRDLEGMEEPNVEVVESCRLFEEDGNPVQTAKGHSVEEAEAVGRHLQRQLELVVSKVFSEAALAVGDVKAAKEKVKVRWVSAYFPFTSPSYELEVLWNNEWLEVLGCGVIRQDLLDYAGKKGSIGWAFGLGIERIAMLMYGIPDIRLFWSADERFKGQFREGVVKRFEPFSKYPQCFKDVAFWVGEERGAGAAGGAGGVEGKGVEFHENDFMELVRGVGGDLVEDVKLIDEFTHPKTGRKSMCYRINYRSLERTLTNEEVDELQAKVRSQLEEKMGVQLR